MERFVVGTGRCGSTLLSRMLACHPRVLSIFEFFTGLDRARRFADGAMPGEELAALLAAEQPLVTLVLRRGYEVPEIVYPFGPRARYRRSDPLPWLLVTCLSRQSGDPDHGFDETLAFARGLPSQPPAAHYRALFGWWVQRAGRAVWVERSGSSVEYLGDLAEAFPEAHFLHLHRDGAETALSMREHAAYRLAVGLLYRPEGFVLPDLAGDRVAPDGSDGVSRYLASHPPAEVFGRYWSDQLERGLAALPGLAAGRYRAVAFEDLLARPCEVLREIEGFFELPPARGWIEDAAALVQGAPALRAPALPAAERSRLLEACRAGARLLGREP